MDTIKISGINYTIEELSPDEMNGNIGLADFNCQRIMINNTFSNQTKMIARWHEMIHIIDTVYGTNLTEEQVVTLTHGMLAVFLDNPDLLDILNKY
jgi:hypothetical protein